MKTFDENTAMDNDKAKANRFLFALAFVFSCLTMNSNYLPGYYAQKSTFLVILRFVLIFVFMFAITLLNRKDSIFISKFVPITTLIITALLIFDRRVTQISGNQFLYGALWIAYIATANITVLLALAVSKASDYEKILRNTWMGLTLLYFYTLKICFLRKPGTSLSINLKLFNGTFPLLKHIINHPGTDFEYYMIFFGNIVIFFPLAFIVYAIFNNIKSYQLMLIGLAAPFLVEGYQYIFKCGNVDIDDVILNWTGFFIGFIILQIIKKRLLENE